jgi:hypothetical protein
MPQISKMELGRELFHTVTLINRQMEAVKENAKSLGVDPTMLRDGHGNWVLIPLLAAKAQCFHALAIINQRD